MSRKGIYLFGLFIYLILIFSIEIAYRNPLYDKSVEYIENLNQSGFFYYFYSFWSIIYLMGMIFIGFLIVLFYYPINIFFCHFSILLFSIFVMCIFKSLYASPRPYWDIFLKWESENKSLPKPTECDGEFGNPSGHAFLNIYSLYLWHLFINSKFVENSQEKTKKIAKILTLILTIFFMIFVVYSRVHRQVHSFNQIIHGTFMSFPIFVWFCYIFEYHKIDTHDFILLINRNKFIIIPLLLVLFIISLIFGLTIHNDKEKEYARILKIICKFEENDSFGKNTAFISSLIFIIIGGYFGLLYLKHKINKSEKNLENIISNWNKGSKLNTIIIAVCSFLIPFILLLPIVLIPSSQYILRYIICLICEFLSGFLSFGPMFCYCCEKFKSAENNENISLISKENEEHI